MAQLYLSACAICVAIDVTEPDWRCLRRVFAPDIASRHPRREDGKCNGKILYLLDDVVAFLSELPALLSFQTELQLRESAKQFEEHV